MVAFNRFSVILALVLGALSLGGCASFLDFGTAEYSDKDYDRGYAYERHDEEDDDEDNRVTVGRGLASTRENDGDTQGTTFIKRAIATRDVVLGMSREEVLRSWGEPSMREVAGRGGTGHERWTYRSRYSLQRDDKTVIFENGRVAGWYR